MSSDTTTPDTVIIAQPMLARDFFLMAMQASPMDLATALSTKPDETYTLKTTISLTFTREDTIKMLTDAGYEITFPQEARPEGSDPDEMAESEQ